MTKDRARKKKIRARMTASGEPFSVAARKLDDTKRDDINATDQIAARIDATLAESTARFSIRQGVVDTSLEPGESADTPFARLVSRVLKAAWERAVSEQTRRRLRDTITGGPGAVGVVEPTARRLQMRMGPHAVACIGDIWYSSWSGEPWPDGEPQGPSDWTTLGENPLHLLTRLRGMTPFRYAGDEPIRQTRCRKFTAGDDVTVWIDDEHVRQVTTVTSRSDDTASIETLELWDFGLAGGALDWTGFPAASDHPAGG